MGVFKIFQSIAGRHVGQVAHHAGGKHILHLVHHLIGVKVHDAFLSVRYYFQLVVVDHDKVVHGLGVVHAYLIALFIIERSFRGYFLIEYIQIFYLSEITFDGLYIFSLLQQTGFKIFQISKFLHLLGLHRQDCTEHQEQKYFHVGHTL